MRARSSTHILPVQPMEIIKFLPEHAREGAEIERLCFSEPWSESAMGDLATPPYVAFSAVEDGRLVGYVGMLCCFGEGNIVNVATHPDYRRRGYAGKLLDRIIDYSIERGDMELLFLEVRESNDAAISLYRSKGFSEVGRRPKFYTKPIETAIIMAKPIITL